jgi:pyrroloquinoline quinone biosynthesis protein E
MIVVSLATLASDPMRKMEKRPAASSEIQYDDWRLRLPTPDPALGLGVYNRERWIALATSPRRLLNYIKYVWSGRRSANVSYHPIKLDIENVSRCNFRCTMCQVSEWPRYKRADDMAFEDFRRLIDHEFGLVEIKLQGMGEPTLGGETYFRMIRYARKKHIWVRTTTNASTLHLRDTYKKLVDSGVNEIQISIDGAKKATFEKIRVGSNFEVVKRNCKLLNDYCEKKRRYVTKMWTVVQRDNFAELPGLVELAHELGFRSLGFDLTVTGWGQDSWNERVRAISMDDALSQEMATALMERAERLGIVLRWWYINSKYSASSPSKLCPWPFERAYISSDMRVVPCCIIANPQVADLGDGRQFAQVWQGSNYREFRQAHLEGRIPKICRMCYRTQAGDANGWKGDPKGAGLALPAIGSSVEAMSDPGNPL